MSPQRYKYPRTPHLSFSPGVGTDDLKLDCDRLFQNKQVVVTEKLDGENTTLYADYLHPRSIDSRHHPSRTWVKALQAAIANNIPLGWRICGENLYARHSIAYNNLKSYFYVFSIWDEANNCLSWSDTQEWAAILELELVPVIYRGIWDKQTIVSLAKKLDLNCCEGYVVRNAAQFNFDEFSGNIAKWVRQNHVQTDKHWMHREIVPNGLSEF